MLETCLWTHQCSKWGGVGQFGIRPLLWPAWNHSGRQHFWLTTAIPVYIVMAVLLTPNTFSGLEISHTCICGQDSAPDPTGVAYSAPPDSLAGWGVGGGTEWEGEGEGRGTGPYWYSLFPLQALELIDANVPSTDVYKHCLNITKYSLRLKRKHHHDNLHFCQTIQCYFMHWPITMC